MIIIGNIRPKIIYSYISERADIDTRSLYTALTQYLDDNNLFLIIPLLTTINLLFC